MLGDRAARAVSSPDPDSDSSRLDAISVLTEHANGGELRWNLENDGSHNANAPTRMQSVAASPCLQ